MRPGRARGGNSLHGELKKDTLLISANLEPLSIASVLNDRLILCYRRLRTDFGDRELLMLYREDTSILEKKYVFVCVRVKSIVVNVLHVCTEKYWV